MKPSYVARTGLSRTTVRQGLDALANEGVIERRQGRGTFVAAPKRAEAVVYFGTFAEELAADGRRGSARLVSAEVIDADSHIAGRLRLGLRQSVWKILRVRLNDGQPSSYQVSFVPCALMPQMSPAERRLGSFYDRLERLLGEPLTDAEESIEALLADSYRAELLNVPIGVPLLVLERVVFSKSGRPVEYNRSFYDALMVRFMLHSKRGSAEHVADRLRFRDPAEREEASTDA